MTEPSINPNSTPPTGSGGPEGAQGGRVGTERRPGGLKGAQAGAQGLGRFGPLAITHALHDMATAQRAAQQGIDSISRTLNPPEHPMPDLTRRQRKLLLLHAAGQTNDHIARSTRMSPTEIAAEINVACRGLGATDREQAAAIAQRMGLFDGEHIRITPNTGGTDA